MDKLSNKLIKIYDDMQVHEITLDDINSKNSLPLKQIQKLSPSAKQEEKKI